MYIEIVTVQQSWTAHWQMVLRSNTGRFLVPVVCKVRNSRSAEKFVNLLQWNLKSYRFIEGRMHKKREKSCHLFINVLQKRKIFESVTTSSFKEEIAPGNCPPKGWVVQINHVFSLTSRQDSLSYSLQWKSLSDKE